MAESKPVTVLLYSGGLDSYCLRYLLKPDYLLYVNVGSAYAGEEMKRLSAEVKVVNLEWLSTLERENKILPARNLIFATIAACYGSVVYLGATEGDRVRDKTEEFSSQASDLLTYLFTDYWNNNSQKITVSLPFKTYTKAEIVNAYLNAGGNIAQLARESYSCYSGQAQECGQCKPCYRKYVALRLNGYTSPHYQRNPLLYIQSTILPALLHGSVRGREDLDVLKLVGE